MTTHKDIIATLGGIRAVARKLGHTSHTTVQGWYDRDQIPVGHWSDVIRVSIGTDHVITVDDLVPAELRSTNKRVAA